MSGWRFHVGQKVVYVDGSKPNLSWDGHTIPVLGAVYTVRELISWQGLDGLLLHEISNPVSAGSGLECGFLAHRFRPVQTTSIEVFRALLNPKPEDVERERQDEREVVA